MQPTDLGTESRALWRALRWAALGAVSIAGFACGGSAGSEGQGAGEKFAQSTSALMPSCTPRAKVEAVRVHGDPFLHRTGHAVAKLDDALYVARGLADDIDAQANTFRDDLFRLDAHPRDRATFTQLQERGDSIPGNLGYPCMVGDEDGSGSLLLFGGADYVFELDPNFFQSFTPSAVLWKYTTANRKWTPLGPSGAGPSARNGCTAERVHGSMYVFGGLGKFLVPNGDLWRYDIGANAWTELTPSGPTPPARFISASVADHETGRIYLYNGLGVTPEGFQPIGDFWVYDIAQNTWRQLPQTPTPPRAKGVFSMLHGPCEKNYLVYTGGNIDTTVHCEGFDENTTATNEIWAFDVQAETWQKLDTLGTAPRIEFAQGATLNNMQYVIGGWSDEPDPARICKQVWNETVYEVSLVDE